VRERNHRVNLALAGEMAAGRLDALLFTQEDAAARGIHRLEQRALCRELHRLGIGDRTWIHPGADEAALPLISRVILLAARETPTAKRPIEVEFWPPESASTIPPYEDRTIAESVESQIAAAGGDRVVRGDLSTPVVLIYCQPPGREERDSAMRLADRLARLLSTRACVGLVDLSIPNGASVELMRTLIGRGLIAGLAAFAAWNTAGNSIGTVIPHLLCQAGERAVEPRSAAHYARLLECLADDWLYQSEVRPALNSNLRERGVLPANLGARRAEISREVACRLQPRVEALFNQQFRGVACAEGRLTAIDRLTIRLPWPRTFEVEVTIRLRTGRLQLNDRSNNPGPGSGGTTKAADDRG
jgi:hypothetical protein